MILGGMPDYVALDKDFAVCVFGLQVFRRSSLPHDGKQHVFKLKKSGRTMLACLVFNVV